VRQPIEVDIKEFQELGEMNPNIRCRLATQPSDQVVLQGRFVVGGHNYALSSLCRNATGTQYEIFAQRNAGGRREQLKFDGQLVKDARGNESLRGEIRLQ
jgi:hypothetical protein